MTKALIVKSGDDRLPGTGGCYHKIAIETTYLALGVQLVQNLLLIGIWRDIEYVRSVSVAFKLLLRLQRPFQPLPLLTGVVLKIGGIPVAFKGRGDLLNRVRQILYGNLDVPFESAGNGGVGEVR